MAKRQPGKLSITEQLRQLLDESGLTSYRVWQETGIPQSVLSRFKRGETMLSAKAIDKLGELLGVELTKKRR